MTTYRHLRSSDELDAAFAASAEGPVVIFKHSLTCPVSSAALREYERFLADRKEDSEALFTLIEIQPNRDLSSQVASRTGVRHESPQAILLQAGEVTWHASHWKITAATLNEALAEVAA